MPYVPPSPEQLEKLKEELGLSSGSMAKLFALANGRQWRRYLAEDPSNRRDMGLHMLFFGAAHLVLDKKTIDRVYAQMRRMGAAYEPDTEQPSD